MTTNKTDKTLIIVKISKISVLYKSTRNVIQTGTNVITERTNRNFLKILFPNVSCSKLFTTADTPS